MNYPNKSKDYIPLTEAAELIGMHRTGLLYNVKHDRFDVPYVMFGNRFFFVPDQIKAWYEENAHRMRSAKTYIPKPRRKSKEPRNETQPPTQTLHT